MGLMDTLFGRDVQTTPLNEEWQQAGAYGLAKSAKPGAQERLSRAGEPYAGDLVAPMSGAEQTSQDLLSQYLAGSPATSDPLFQAAQGELTNTLSGETYDPVAGAYYQAYRNAAMRELAQAKDRLAARTSASDQLFGGGRIAEEGKLEEGVTTALAGEMGRLTENERMNRLNAVNPAMQMTAYKEQAPLARIGAAQELGALPRQIDQAQLDAAYLEWNRQLADLGISLDVYTGMLTYNPSTAVQTMPSIADILKTGIAAAQAGGGMGTPGATPT